MLKLRMYDSSCPGLYFNMGRSVLDLPLVLLTLKVQSNNWTKFVQVMFGNWVENSLFFPSEF